jgi:hypothetical protein
MTESAHLGAQYVNLQSQKIERCSVSNILPFLEEYFQ